MNFEDIVNVLSLWVRREYLAHFPEHHVQVFWLVAALAFILGFVFWWLSESFQTWLGSLEPHFKKKYFVHLILRLHILFFRWATQHRLSSFLLLIALFQFGCWAAFGIVSVTAISSSNLEVTAAWWVYSGNEQTPTIFVVRRGENMTLANIALYLKIKNRSSEPLQVSELSFDVRGKDGDWEPLVRLKDLSAASVLYVPQSPSSARKIGQVLLSSALIRKSIPAKETVNGLVLLDCTASVEHRDPLEVQMFDKTSLGEETVPVLMDFKLKHELVESDIDDDLDISGSPEDITHLKSGWERHRASNPTEGQRVLNSDALSGDLNEVPDSMLSNFGARHGLHKSHTGR